MLNKLSELKEHLLKYLLGAIIALIVWVYFTNINAQENNICELRTEIRAMNNLLQNELKDLNNDVGISNIRTALIIEILSREHPEIKTELEWRERFYQNPPRHRSQQPKQP